MSWSLKLIGKKEVVAVEAAKRFSTGFTYLSGVEAELKDAAASTVEKALSGCTDGQAVEIDCGGSASRSGDEKAGTLIQTQNFWAKVTPIWGFVQ
jgi:hypothetical protein